MRTGFCKNPSIEALDGVCPCNCCCCCCCCGVIGGGGKRLVGSTLFGLCGRPFFLGWTVSWGSGSLFLRTSLVMPSEFESRNTCRHYKYFTRQSLFFQCMLWKKYFTAFRYSCRIKSTKYPKKSRQSKIIDIDKYVGTLTWMLASELHTGIVVSLVGRSMLALFEFTEKVMLEFS